jgi:multiple sugar transport system ATP-binding protein
MASLLVSGVTKRFDDTLAVADVTLDVADREFLVLLGPSGCGKSTLLRLIAGLETPDGGEISIDGAPVGHLPPSQRDLAMVFQSYALYPHKSARRNIEIPLRTRKVPRAERDRMVGEAARALSLDDLLDRKPAQLSGGQRQRVALARAIVRRPAVFLMDEPLSNLDAALRVQTRAELIQLRQRLESTFVYVTHDQVEAMTMADRIAVMHEGRLQQLGPPSEVYDRPANTVVARFIGSPPMNLLRGSLGSRGDEPLLLLPGLDPLPLPLAHAAAVADSGGREVVVGFRPEHVTLADDGPLATVVRLVEALGHERVLHCELTGGERIAVRVPAHVPVPHEGESARLTPDHERLHLFAAADGRRLG